MIRYNIKFRTKFGNVFYLEPGGGAAYDPNDAKGAYHFPDSMSEAEIEELMERCVRENKDLIIDLVKDNPVVYEKGLIY